jgi:hypothetical protein
MYIQATVLYKLRRINVTYLRYESRQLIVWLFNGTARADTIFSIICLSYEISVMNLSRFIFNVDVTRAAEVNN